ACRRPPSPTSHRQIRGAPSLSRLSRQGGDFDFRPAGFVLPGPFTFLPSLRDSVVLCTYPGLTPWAKLCRPSGPEDIASAARSTSLPEHFLAHQTPKTFSSPRGLPAWFRWRPCVPALILLQEYPTPGADCPRIFSGDPAWVAESAREHPQPNSCIRCNRYPPTGSPHPLWQWYRRR